MTADPTEAFTRCRKCGHDRRSHRPTCTHVSWIGGTIEVPRRCECKEFEE